MNHETPAASPPVASVAPSCATARARRACTLQKGDLATLTKARLTALVLATTVVGFLLASGAGVNWPALLHTLAGTALVASAAAVLNQVLERGRDALMRRTCDRPLAAGRLAPAAASALGVTLAVAGVCWLALAVGHLPAAVALLTLASYLCIYTPMKTRTSACTLAGGVSGALPPVIGWTAAGGALDAGALSLFAILFFWQMPHFVAINWMHRADYERAGFRMWSNGDVSGHRTAALALMFTVLLAAASLGLPEGFRSPAMLAVSAALAVPMLWLALRFLSLRTRPAARALFLYTLAYLPLELGALVLLIPA